MTAWAPRPTAAQRRQQCFGVPSIVLLIALVVIYGHTALKPVLRSASPAVLMVLYFPCQGCALLALPWLRRETPLEGPPPFSPNGPLIVRAR